MSFKPEVTTGSDPKFYGNALAFATREEAEANAKDLFGRWTLCTGWRAAESTDPVTHTYVNGVLGDAPKRVFKLTPSSIAGLIRVCEDNKPERCAIWMGPVRGAVVDVREQTMDELNWPPQVQDSINAWFKAVFDLAHEKRPDLSLPSPRAVFIDAAQPWTVEVLA
jgi:hypothetical protein